MHLQRFLCKTVSKIRNQGRGAQAVHIQTIFFTLQALAATYRAQSGEHQSERTEIVQKLSAGNSVGIAHVALLSDQQFPNCAQQIDG